MQQYTISLSVNGWVSSPCHWVEIKADTSCLLLSDAKLMNGTSYFSSDLQALYWEIVLFSEALQKLKGVYLNLKQHVVPGLHVEADNVSSALLSSYF